MLKIDNVLAQVRLATSKTRLDMINTRVVLQVAKQLITLQILEKISIFPLKKLNFANSSNKTRRTDIRIP